MISETTTTAGGEGGIADQFFDGGWCWMCHPDWNEGNAIPVKMEEVDGTRYYIPLDPSGACDFQWDRRDDEWEMVEGPMAQVNAADHIATLRAANKRLGKALTTSLRAMQFFPGFNRADGITKQRFNEILVAAINEARAALTSNAAAAANGEME